MFSRAFRPVIFSANARLSHATNNTIRRGHSIISTHAFFPATLIGLNAGPVFKSFPFERPAQNDKLNTDHQLGKPSDNHKDSEVWTNYIPLRSATLLPNTLTMQQIIRAAAENYIDDEENGLSIERPYIFTIPKGTALPTTLLLLRETPGFFSLQPSQPISSSDLEHILAEFYTKYASKQEVMEWLTSHEWADAIPTENENEWMAV